VLSSLLGDGGRFVTWRLSALTMVTHLGSRPQGMQSGTSCVTCALSAQERWTHGVGWSLVHANSQSAQRNFGGLVVHRVYGVSVARLLVTLQRTMTIEGYGMRGVLAALRPAAIISS
jgi:hypothetical protein